MALVNYGLLRHENKIEGVPLIVIFTRAAGELADSDGCDPLSKQFEGSFKKELRPFSVRSYLCVA